MAVLRERYQRRSRIVHADARAGARQVARREIPHRLGRHVRLAVDFLAAGAGAAGRRRAVDADEAVRRRRGVRGMLGVVGVADAGAGGAGVAIAGAVAAQEAGAEAGVVEGDQRRGVAVGLARGAVGGGAGRVVLVDAVAELVQRDAGDLAGVGAAAARLEEVERRAVPVGVAGQVEVDVDVELGVDPGVGGQPAADDLLDPVDLVELLARGVGVAGAAMARRRAVGARGGAEGDVAGAVRGLGDRAAAVGDLDVGAGEVEVTVPLV